jgi:hypothetical protein
MMYRIIEAIIALVIFAVIIGFTAGIIIGIQIGAEATRQLIMEEAIQLNISINTLNVILGYEVVNPFVM